MTLENYWPEPSRPNLSSAEIERLAKLNEELGEAIQVIGKILVHGYDSASPVEHQLGQESNRVLLARELADVLLWMSKLEEANDIDADIFDQHIEKKSKTINQYLHHNKFD